MHDIWLMNDGQMGRQHHHRIASGRLGAIGISDFEQDGTDDVVCVQLRRTTMSMCGWSRTGTGRAAWGLAHTPGSTLIGVGDFDHNGVTDIMWRDANTGHVETWLLA